VTFQLQTDKNSFQFHILYMGINPLKKDASTRTKEDIQSIKRSATSKCSRCISLPSGISDTLMSSGNS
jgi:hypothetical protein